MQTYQNALLLATGHSEVEGRVQTSEFLHTELPNTL